MAAIRAGGRRSCRLQQDLTIGEFQKRVGICSTFHILQGEIGIQTENHTTTRQIQLLQRPEILPNTPAKVGANALTNYTFVLHG